MANRSAAGGIPVLCRRTLGRATLERQMLLRRTAMPASEALDRLVGLQAQIPAVPYLALWSRLAGFRPEELGELIAERAAVRAPLMRATIHLVTAQDCLDLRPLLQPVLARTFASTSWARHLAGADLDAIVAAGRDVLAERPLTRAALSRALAQRWSDLDPSSLGIAVTYLLPSVQVPPRGVWGQSGAPTWAPVSTWLGMGPATATLNELVLRYLAAFGPASVRDIQAWCALTRLREITDRLGDRLRRFRTEDGVELLDLPEAARPAPDTVAPVRFLPEYDNALLSYADRSRVIADADHVPMQGGKGGYVGTVLVDGLVSAMWALRRADGQSSLTIRPSVPLNSSDVTAVTEEGVRMVEFLAPGGGCDIRVADR